MPRGPYWRPDRDAAFTVDDVLGLIIAVMAGAFLLAAPVVFMIDQRQRRAFLRTARIADQAGADLDRRAPAIPIRGHTIAAHPSAGVPVRSDQ